MKSFISFSTALILLFSSLNLSAQVVDKTLVKSFNLSGNKVVLLDVGSDRAVTVNEWNQDQMRVTMTLSLDNGSDQMLKSLVKVGRYNIDSALEPGQLRVFLPGLEKEVKLRNGSQLIENIHFEIFVPANVLVKTKDGEYVAEKGGAGL